MTYGRTGSTLLMGWLNALPGFHILGENAGVLPALHRSVLLLRRFHPRKSDTTEATDPWYGFNDLDVDAFERDLAGLAQRHLMRAPPDSLTVGFKEIRHFHGDPDQFDDYIAFLLERFPDTGVLFLTRDIRDVMRSVTSVGWRAPGQQRVRETATRIDASRFRDDPRCYTLDYAELVGDEAAMARLSAFLGVSFDPALWRTVLGARHSYAGSNAARTTAQPNAASATRRPIPALSVLLPVHNGARHLREAVDSVLAQDFADFELLALDDGSTDDTATILADYARRDPRVRTWSRENRGLVATLNELAEAARAPLLARMDADDVCLPGRFARQIAALTDNRQIGVVGGAVRLIDEDGREIRILELPRRHNAIDALNLAGHAALVHPAVMMRAGALSAAGGYDAAFETAEDLELWLRMAETTMLTNLPGPPILRYRLNTRSVSARNAERQRRTAQAACEAAWTRRGLSDQRYTGRPWRPGADRASRATFFVRYAWQAWRAGNRDTARVYAWRAVRLRPEWPGAWKAALFTALRPSPTERSAAATEG